MDLSCNLTIGFLKLSEMLRGQEELTARFYRVLEEYVENYFQRVALRLDGQTFSRILLSGRQLDSIAALCGGREEKGALVVERRQLEEMYALLKGMNASTVAREMQLSEEVADQIAPMLAIYRRMLDITQAKKLVAPPVNLMEILGRPAAASGGKAAFEQARGRGPWPPAAGWPCREGADAAMPRGCAASASCCSASSKSSTASTRNGWSCWNARRCCTNWGTGPTSKTRRRRPMI